MPVAITELPDRQLAQLTAAYAGAMRQKRDRLLIGGVIFIACLIAAAYGAEVNLGKMFGNIGNFTSYFARIFTFDMQAARPGTLVFTDPVEWYWGLGKWSALMGETLLISYVGTLTGAFFAFILCFFCTSNLMPVAWVRFCARRFLEFCRTVPDLVFALIFVVSFGLGPLPGVLALAIHTMGALGKLFTEVVENIDMKPVEGLKAAGAGWVATIRYAVAPQILSNFLTYGLLRFEINVRGASVMGFVGAGGIGQDLLEAIRKFYYSDVSAILLLVVVTVFVIDITTERLRHRLISGEQRK